MAEPMTEEQARARCADLAKSHPDRATHQFLPKRVEGGWGVVKIGVPPPEEVLNAETRADERPATGEDPRDSLSRNVGGQYPGAF